MLGKANCEPDKVVIARPQRITSIRRMGRLCRHVGVVGADVADFCCDHFDLSGVLLFTTATSVIASTRAINAEIGKLQEASSTDKIIGELIKKAAKKK